MTKQDERVVIRLFNGDVIAFWPYQLGTTNDSDTCPSYMYQGEHAPCNADGVFNASAPVSTPTRNRMIERLKLMGYDPKVISRYDKQSAFSVRHAQLMELKDEPFTVKSGERVNAHILMTQGVQTAHLVLGGEMLAIDAGSMWVLAVTPPKSMFYYPVALHHVLKNFPDEASISAVVEKLGSHPEHVNAAKVCSNAMGNGQAIELLTSPYQLVCEILEW